jgi:hypothetical protein
MQLVVFPLLGPLIGAVTFHILARAIGEGPQSPWMQPWEFVAGFMLGLVPAFFTGICDALLSIKISRWWRMPVTASAGFALSALMTLVCTARQRELQSKSERLECFISFDERKQSTAHVADPKYQKDNLCLLKGAKAANGRFFRLV